MVADLLIGLSLWTATSIVTAIVLGWVLQMARSAARHGDHLAGHPPLSGAR
jgi:hypothetical protein